MATTEITYGDPYGFIYTRQEFAKRNIANRIRISFFVFMLFYFIVISFIRNRRCVHRLYAVSPSAFFLRVASAVMRVW